MSIDTARKVFAKKETDLTTPEKRAEEKVSKVGGIAALERRAGKTYAPAKGIWCAEKTHGDGEGFAAGFAIKDGSQPAA